MASCDFLSDESARHPPKANCPMAYPTPPRPTRAVREAGFEHFLPISARISPSTKSGSRRKGTLEEGLSLVGGPSNEPRCGVSMVNI